MPDKIRVMIVDDNDDTRDGTRRLLEYEDNIDIVGFAENGQVAVDQARELKPMVILMDINMPVMDGLSATEIIKRELPATQIIVVSVQDDAHYMRQAFQKGAFDFVAKPITSAELAHAIERAAQEFGKAPLPSTFPPPEDTRGDERRPRTPHTDANGSVVAVMAVKGGVGKTTIAVSLGVGLARAMPDKRVLIVDGNLLFGDLAVFLNTRGQYNILDVVQMASEFEGIDEETLKTVLVPHSESGAQLLLAPSNPNESRSVGVDLMASALELLKREFHYIILDTATNFDEVSAAALRAADRIIVVANGTMPALKNARFLFTELTGAEYQKDNILLVLNEVDAKNNRITPEQIGNFLKHPVTTQIPDDPMAVEAVNQGIPLISLDAKRSTAARPLANLVQLVKESLEKSDIPEQAVEEPQRRKGLFGR